jgi:hypothetical protein
MAINKWQAGTIYIPGSLVIPTTVPGAVPTPIPNANFDAGDSDWTKGTGWAINTNLSFSGTYSAEYSGPGAADLVSSTKHAVEPGKAITATCFIHQGASNDGEASASVALFWYNAADALISTSVGNSISYGSVGTWYKSTVSATAPPLAAKVSIGCSAYNDWAALNVDDFAWNYITGAAATGMAYKAATEITAVSYGPATDISFVDTGVNDMINRASGSWIDDGWKAGSTVTVSGSVSNDGTYTTLIVATSNLLISGNLVVEGAGASITVTQDAGTLEAGTSGYSEPVWPLDIGGTVKDGTVIWIAVAVDSVTWEASSVLTSGSSEPSWPTTPNAFVMDNNIAWETVPLRITDEKCPHSKVVAIAASKIFAGDTDVVRFSATLNARDWSTEDDAGFLPSGLQQKSQVGVDAMGVYRGNLAVWSASTFQVWQVDPDPAAMALLDAMEGIGSMHQQAVQPVSDDLFFLAALGVRTVAIAEGTNNLATGDVGVPIDTLVQTEVNAGDVEPVASYYPGAGQYWLAFRPLVLGLGLLAGQFLLSSNIYPIEFTDELQNSSTPEYGRLIVYPIEGLQSSTTPVFGSFGAGLTDYQWSEALQNSTGPVLGTWGAELTEYRWSEALQSSTAPVLGLFVGALIEYRFTEALQNSSTPEDGTLV